MGYICARLSLLADATAQPDAAVPDVLTALAPTRRAIELDRFGIAAHVLAVRDGCTAEKCAAFSMLHDASTLKANFKVPRFSMRMLPGTRPAWGKSEARLKMYRRLSTRNSAVASVPERCPYRILSTDDTIFHLLHRSTRQHHEYRAAPPKEPASPRALTRRRRKQALPRCAAEAAQSQAASPPARSSRANRRGLMFKSV